MSLKAAPRRKLKPWARWTGRVSLLVLVCYAVLSCFHFVASRDAPSPSGGTPRPVQNESPAQAQQEPEIRWQSGCFDSRHPFIEQCAGLGIGADVVFGIVEALKSHFDFRKARPAHTWRFGFVGDRAVRFQLQVSPVQEYTMRLDQDDRDVRVHEPPLITLRERHQGTIESSLFQALNSIQQGSRLALKLSAVFAWDIDFYLDPRKGDTVDMLVEALYYEKDGVYHFLEYGDILAASYHASHKEYRAFRFEDEEGETAYFDINGASLIRDVLRSPLKFQRITSKYSHRRFHPVLKSHRPHNGIDYGAPRNTPVMVVANGTVIRAGRYGGAGIAVEVQHTKHRMITQYFHLNGIASGIRRGSKVRQGQVIGYVGKTGLATGYHLHFGMKIGGRYVNPLSQEFEPGEPIPAERMAEYRTVVTQLQTAMNPFLFAAMPPHSRHDQTVPALPGPRAMLKTESQ